MKERMKRAMRKSFISSFLETADVTTLLEEPIRYTPYPKIGERDRWQEIHPGIRDKILAQVEPYREFQWQSATVADVTGFAKGRWDYNIKMDEKRRALALLTLAECIEDKGQYIEIILEGIWSTCEESSWVAPGHYSAWPKLPDRLFPDVEDPYIDLCAANTAQMISWIYYLLRERFDDISASIGKRMVYELKQRIIKPFLKHDDFWWQGFELEGIHTINNWNPWCNYHSLLAAVLIGEDTEIIQSMVTKSLLSVERYINYVPEDGGCEEGATYWGHAAGFLFDYLDLVWSISGGKIDFFKEKKIGDIASFIQKVHINKDFYINFADGKTKNTINAEQLYRFAKRIQNKELGDFALYQQTIEDHCSYNFFDLCRVLPRLFNTELPEKGQSDLLMRKDWWLPGIQVMVARSEQGPDQDQGLFLAVKGGYNDESHNHNDIGNYVVYADGRPVIIDIGVESYNAKTFSKERYTIWTMQSAYHNVPIIGGCYQANGDKYRASEIRYKREDQLVQFSCRLDGAYEGLIQDIMAHRAFKFKRDNQVIEVIDKIFSKEPLYSEFVTIVWKKPLVIGDGVVWLSSDSEKVVLFRFDSEMFHLVIEEIQIQDKKLMIEWGSLIYRLILKSKESLTETTCRIVIERGSSG